MSGNPSHGEAGGSEGYLGSGGDREGGRSTRTAMARLLVPAARLGVVESFSSMVLLPAASRGAILVN